MKSNFLAVLHKQNPLFLSRQKWSSRINGHNESPVLSVDCERQTSKHAPQISDNDVYGWFQCDPSGKWRDWIVVSEWMNERAEWTSGMNECKRGWQRRITTFINIPNKSCHRMKCVQFRWMQSKPSHLLASSPKLTLNWSIFNHLICSDPFAVFWLIAGG